MTKTLTQKQLIDAANYMSPWAWAIHNGLKLIGGQPFNLADHPYQQIVMERTRQKVCRKWAAQTSKTTGTMINIITDGRLASIDMRYVRPGSPNDPRSKLNCFLDEIIASWKETKKNEYIDPATGKTDPIKGGRMTVMHMRLEDPEGIVHLASFGVRPNHAQGVIKAFQRMAPASPLPAEGMSELRHADAGKEVADAAGEGIPLDPAAGDGGGEGTEKSDEMGAGVPGRATGEVPGPEDDDVR